MTRWRVAQALALLATGVLLGLLVWRPATGLTILWSIAIPILPAVFLVQPGLWRNLCPIATLSMLTNRRVGGRILDNGHVPLAGAIGVVLLALLVPARRFLFNSNGLALALAILGVVALAMTLGVLFDRKAGFCSGICPVLPVERLYGQRPLLAIGNPRCAPCTMCTSRGCLDIAQQKAIPQVLGRDRISHAWLGTHFGIFAAAFPGFVVGYNLTANGPVSSAGQVYLTIAGASLLSYGITVTLVRGLNLDATLAMRGLGAFAFAAYYWFAAVAISADLGLPDLAPVWIRGAALALLIAWMSRDLGSLARRRPGRP
jgi:hypothetical protein